MAIYGKSKARELYTERKCYHSVNLITKPELRRAILTECAESMPSAFSQSDIVVPTGGGVTHLAVALFN